MRVYEMIDNYNEFLKENGVAVPDSIADAYKMKIVPSVCRVCKQPPQLEILSSTIALTCPMCLHNRVVCQLESHYGKADTYIHAVRSWDEHCGLHLTGETP